MKTTTFFITALVLFLVVLSCSKSNTTNESTGNSHLKIQAVAGNAPATKATVQRETVAAENVIATLNLTSYNGKTGEIVFSNPEEELQKIKKATTSTINISLSDKHLFSLKTFRPAAGSVENTPILYYDYNGENDGIFVRESKWYILSGYPQGAVLGANEDLLQPAIAAERKENFKKIEAGWKLFMDELEKEEKYIGK
ncbi:MAG: hypothetical protein QM594_20235 [Niabella sp.]